MGQYLLNGGGSGGSSFTPSVTILQASNPAWPIPAHANWLRIILVGGGGGGGGGGSRTTGAVNAGGAGGGVGAEVENFYPVTTDTTLNVVIGAGGTNGVGGAAGALPQRGLGRRHRGRVDRRRLPIGREFVLRTRKIA